MGMPQSRLGDLGTGTCCRHSSPTCIGMSGIIIQGSPTVLTNGLPSARLGDIVLGHCGHIGTVITGSATVRANGLPKARLGDAFSGCFFGVISSGSGNVLTGG